MIDNAEDLYIATSMCNQLEYNQKCSFGRFLDLPFLHLSWTKECIMTEHHNNISGAIFMITSTKLYFPVVTLPINDNINFLENINDLDYLIDPIFKNINRLFVLSFKNGNNDLKRNSFDNYYITLVKIKDFNALINNKPFFDQPVKNKIEL